MARAFLSCLFSNKDAAAAAEMAIVTPILVALMFGSFEMGNYFLSEHVVAKAVRDGARFAARQPFTSFTCPSSVDSGVVTNTQNVTRTGQVTSGGSGRLAGWTSASTVSVTLNCTAITGGNYSGIYKGMTNLPRVKVSATVPYSSLFYTLGFTRSSPQLVSESEATVQGI
jgi:Flp pilus assembly protein TadG